ncbi:MaoC family dehydratase [Frankia tisae]|uniref:MaoC family dehydratase n=1 Tax=Frankia tisae TaxID=2950104 RepID=UPI0021C06411|nr:MaoC family dehydratase [Frankia tisae]
MTTPTNPPTNGPATSGDATRAQSGTHTPAPNGATGAATPPLVARRGWEGRYFEDFAVGDVYDHPLGRTITATDNTWFTLLTQNTARLHFDQHYAAQTGFGRTLVNSTLTLALVTGQSVTDVSQNVMANLGWDEVRLPHPVFEGDTVYSRSIVLGLRPSKSRPDVGVVEVRTHGYNQDGDEVISFRRTLLAYRRGHGPRPPALPPLPDSPAAR